MAEQRKQGRKTTGQSTSISRNENNFRGDRSNITKRASDFEEEERPPLEGEQLRNQDEAPPPNNSEYEKSRRNNPGRSGKMADASNFKVNTGSWNFKDAVEPYIVRDSKPRLIRVVDVEPFENENGQQSVKVTFDIPKEPYARPFNRFVNFPHESQTPTQLNNALYWTGQFIECFKIEFDHGEDVDPVNDWMGKTGWVVLTVRSQKGFEDSNSISRFLKHE